MSARASGNDAKDGGSSGAQNRAHHDGSSSRSYTVEQKAAVVRVRKCSPTAFYDILGLEETKTTCSEGEIKKAYRKLSLLTHPDKNGYDGADEAFKLVSKAFQILSDPDKKTRFDKFGGDPDSRHSAAAAGASPFGRASARSGGDWSSFDEQEITPEELFRQFFGGGGGGGFPGFGFDTGPQFVFNVGGPGFRVHQFGGAGPHRRPAAQANGRPAQETTSASFIATVLPILLLFVLPLITSFFSNSSPGPSFAFQHTPSASLTKHYVSGRYGVEYYANPAEIKSLSSRQKREFEGRVEVKLHSDLNQGCYREREAQQEMANRAQGWFSVDEDLMDKARKMKQEHCEKLAQLEKKINRR